jgi:hypothetical protein
MLSPTQMKNFSDASVGLFSVSQISALNIADSNINIIPGSIPEATYKINSLLQNLYVSQFSLFSNSVASYIRNDKSPAQPGFLLMSLSAFQVENLDGNLYSGYQMNDVRNMPYTTANNKLRLTYLSTTQIAYLTYAQIVALAPIYITTTYLSLDGVKAYNNNILSMSDPSGIDITSVPDYQLKQLDPTISSNVVFANKFTATQINSFSQGQLLAFNSKLINQLVISNLNNQTLAKFDQSYLTNMTTQQIQEFTQSQIQNNNTFALFLTAIPTKLTVLQVSWLSSAHQIIVNSALNAPTPLSFAINSFTSLINSVAFTQNQNQDLGAFSDTVDINMSLNDAKALITYSIKNDDQYRFFVDKTKFKPVENQYDNILSWGSTACKTSNLAIPEDFAMNLIKRIFPNTSNVSIDYWDNISNQLSTLRSNINNSVNAQITSVLSEIDISSGTGSVDTTNNNYRYVTLSGSDGNTSTPVNLPTQILNFISANQNYRLLSNIPTNGIYNMPFIAGDTLKFIVGINGDSLNKVNNQIVSRRYLMNIMLV